MCLVVDASKLKHVPILIKKETKQLARSHLPSSYRLVLRAGRQSHHLALPSSYIVLRQCLYQILLPPPQVAFKDPCIICPNGTSKGILDENNTDDKYYTYEINGFHCTDAITAAADIESGTESSRRHLNHHAASIQQS